MPAGEAALRWATRRLVRIWLVFFRLRPTRPSEPPTVPLPWPTPQPWPLPWPPAPEPDPAPDSTKGVNVSKQSVGGHLYVQTSAIQNAVVHFLRASDGTITEAD